MAVVAEAAVIGCGVGAGWREGSGELMGRPRKGDYRKLLEEHVGVSATKRPQWLADLLAARSEPAPLGLPVVTPESYRKIGCKCGGCEVCRWYRLIDAESWEGLADRRLRPRPVTERPRWPSVEAALEALVAHRADGYGAASPSGSLVRLAEQGPSGATGGVPRPPAAMRVAEDLAAVDAALGTTYGPGADRGIGAEACREILIARVVGRPGPPKRDRYGRPWRRLEAVPVELLAEHYVITKRTVGELVKSGLRRLRVVMAARGLVPQPKPSAGLAEEIEREQAALAARRQR